MPKYNKECVFKAVDEHEHLIYGEVYSPMRPDSDNEIMTASDIKKMAHDFLKNHKLDQIDVQHDNNLNPGASVVESFIARKNDDTFIEGSWVVGIHVPDSDTWGRILKGEINGFSIEAMVTKMPLTLEMEIPPVVNGITTKSEDHEHNFFVTFDNDGKFLGGRTNVEKGHFHTIRAGTVTDTAQDHNHRFSFVENAYTNPVQMASIMKSAAECGVFPHKVDFEMVPEVQVIAAVETPVEAAEASTEVVTEIAKAQFPLANGKGADTPKDTEKDGDGDDIKLKPKKFKLAVKEAVSEVLKAMGITPPEVPSEVVEKGGAGSGRRNKNAAPGPWVVHNTDTGELHAVHPSYGKAMNQADSLNEAHFNHPDTVPDKYGMVSGKYGAMAKSTWDAQNPVSKEE